MTRTDKYRIVAMLDGDSRESEKEYSTQAECEADIAALRASNPEHSYKIQKKLGHLDWMDLDTANSWDSMTGAIAKGFGLT